VRRILRGHRREETSRFIAFRSHWRYQSEFCNPARGNEKGGVEGEGGHFRRNHWVPVPEARSLDELNGYLEHCSNQDRRRILSGRTETVGAAMLNEQPHLLPLAAEPFNLAEISFPTVDSLRCVRVRTNRYSVPLPPGTKVEARVHAAAVELRHGGKRVAWHERCYSRQQKILDLEHYLDVLRKKPGALAAGGTMAGILRSVVAGVELAPWPIPGHTADDRTTRTRHQSGLGPITCCRRTVAVDGLP
jgi:hypothetical protein